MNTHYEETPKVTVLMSVYNGERYLSEAIESILNQTFTDFEFLIINDGSSGAIREIITSYKDDRIRLIDNETNIGLTRSLNKGIELAKGKYIARMDADDISLPERLEKQVEFMEEHGNIAVCGSSAFIIDSNSEILHSISMPLKHESIVGSMFFGNCIIHSSVCFSKKKILDIGGYNDEYVRTQDYELWYRCIVEGLTLENCATSLIKLRKHSDIISVKCFKEQEYYARKVLRKLFKDILAISCSKKSIDAYRKVILSEKNSAIGRIRLFFLIKKIESKKDIVFLHKEETLNTFDESFKIHFKKYGSNSLKIKTQKLMNPFKEKISNPLKRLLKNVLLKVPVIHKYVGSINSEKNALLDEKNALMEKKNALLEEKNALLEERNALLEELAYNYANGSLSISKFNVVNRLLPVLQKNKELIRKKKKIILFIAMPHSIHTARWIAQLCDREEWELHLFPSMDVEGQVHPLLKNITIHLPINKENVDGINLENYFEFELSNLIRKLKPDIVHSLEMQHAGYLTSSAKKILEGHFPKWIYSSWGSDLYYFQHYEFHKQRIQETLSECDFLITDTLRDIEIAKHLGFKGELLGTFPGPGGFEVDKYRALVKYMNPSERKTIVFKGYYGWVYRPMVLLNAIEMCKDMLSGYKIVVYLPGDDLVQEIEEITARTGLAFEFFNYTNTYENVLKLFASARIALASSVSDGTPNTMLEAMMMGAFPIQSDTISTREWINHGVNGMMAAPEKAQEFAECIKESLINNDMVDKAADNNYRLLKQRIDYSIIKPKVIEAYEKVLAGND